MFHDQKKKKKKNSTTEKVWLCTHTWIIHSFIVQQTDKSVILKVCGVFFLGGSSVNFQKHVQSYTAIWNVTLEMLSQSWSWKTIKMLTDCNFNTIRKKHQNKVAIDFSLFTHPNIYVYKNKQKKTKNNMCVCFNFLICCCWQLSFLPSSLYSIMWLQSFHPTKHCSFCQNAKTGCMQTDDFARAMTKNKTKKHHWSPTEQICSYTQHWDRQQKRKYILKKRGGKKEENRG